MATITKLPSGAYRVQIRRKGRHASETLLRRDDAPRWDCEAETRFDQGLAPTSASVSRFQTFGDLIDLHIADMCEVGKPPRRSKAATLTALQRDLGKERIGHLDRQKLIDHGKMRTEQGAGPVTPTDRYQKQLECGESHDLIQSETLAAGTLAKQYSAKRHRHWSGS